MHGSSYTEALTEKEKETRTRQINRSGDGIPAPLGRQTPQRLSGPLAVRPLAVLEKAGEAPSAGGPGFRLSHV